MTQTLAPIVDDAFTAVVPDDDADTSYLEQDGFEDRLAEYQRGELFYVGVRLVVKLKFGTPQGGWYHGPTIETPGLWGIEGDSGEDYYKDVADDEADTLRDMLEGLGFSEMEAAAIAIDAMRDIRYF